MRYILKRINKEGKKEGNCFANCFVLGCEFFGKDASNIFPKEVLKEPGLDAAKKEIKIVADWLATNCAGYLVIDPHKEDETWEKLNKEKVLEKVENTRNPPYSPEDIKMLAESDYFIISAAKDNKGSKYHAVAIYKIEDKIIIKDPICEDEWEKEQPFSVFNSKYFLGNEANRFLIAFKLPLSIPVSGCIVAGNSGKILLLHRNTPTKIQWETPGGKVESNETPQAAAKRECLEEIGVEVEVGKLLGENDFSEGDKNYHYFWFLGTLKGTPVIGEPQKFDKLEYFSWQQLKDMYAELSPNTKNLVTAYFSNQITL